MNGLRYNKIPSFLSVTLCGFVFHSDLPLPYCDYSKMKSKQLNNSVVPKCHFLVYHAFYICPEDLRDLILLLPWTTRDPCVHNALVILLAHLFLQAPTSQLRFSTLLFGSPNNSTIVLAIRALQLHLDTQTVENHPSGYPNRFVGNFLKCHYPMYNWIFFSPISILYNCIRIVYLH